MALKSDAAAEIVCKGYTLRTSMTATTVGIASIVSPIAILDATKKT